MCGGLELQFNAAIDAKISGGTSELAVSTPPQSSAGCLLDFDPSSTPPSTTDRPQ
jgi:hypothetical protein